MKIHVAGEDWNLCSVWLFELVLGPTEESWCGPKAGETVSEES